MNSIVCTRVPARLLLAALMSVFLCGAAFGKDPVSLNGVASWFGAWHHGKNTASGEPFDMYAMTAAHRKLPFGTVLRVTNTRNGQDVVVRVNDRGPYKRKRVLDLSYAAADRLGMRVSGTAPVTMEVVGDESGRPLRDNQAFFVRLEQQKRTSGAVLEQQLDRLIRVGFQDAASLLHTTENAVALGPFETFQEAQDTLVRVATIHPKASIMLADRDKARPVLSAVAVSVSSASSDAAPAAARIL